MPPQAPARILSEDQWKDFVQTQSRLAELEAAENRRAAEAAAAEVRALAAKGQIQQAFDLQRIQAEEALKAERAKLTDIENRARRYALDGELARALAAHPLVQGGADQLTKLIRHEFVVEGQGESFVVRSADFRNVGDYVTAILGRPEYAHFLRAQHPGGGTAGTQGTQSTPTGPPQGTPEAAINNMSDYAMWHAAQSARGGVPAGAAYNPAATGGAVIGEDGKPVPRAAAGFGLRPSPLKRA
jgi:hypothetical protein